MKGTIKGDRKLKITEGLIRVGRAYLYCLRFGGESGGTAGRAGSPTRHPLVQSRTLFPLSTGHKTGLIVFVLTPDCSFFFFPTSPDTRDEDGRSISHRD